MKISRFIYWMAVISWAIACINYALGEIDRAIFSLLFGFAVIAIEIMEQMRDWK